MSADESRVWAEYANACVWIEVDGRRLRFAPEPTASGSELWPFEPNEVVHVLTAHNPGSSHTAKAVNEERQSALEGELRGRTGLQLFAADGADRDRTHIEPSIGVIGLGRDEASALGVAYSQNAVFEISRDELRIVRCDQSTVESRSPYSLIIETQPRP